MDFMCRRRGGKEGGERLQLVRFPSIILWCCKNLIVKRKGRVFWWKQLLWKSWGGRYNWLDKLYMSTCTCSISIKSNLVKIRRRTIEWFPNRSSWSTSDSEGKVNYTDHADHHHHHHHHHLHHHHHHHHHHQHHHFDHFSSQSVSGFLESHQVLSTSGCPRRAKGRGLS